jgi:hypothetical protein
MTGQDDHERVVAALARAFDLLQMPRYAAICRSATTRGILAAYQAGTGNGKAAWCRAVTASRHCERQSQPAGSSFMSRRAGRSAWDALAAGRHRDRFGQGAILAGRRSPGCGARVG